MVVLGLPQKRLFFLLAMKENVTWKGMDSINVFNQSIGVCCWLRRQEWENVRFILRKPSHFHIGTSPAQFPRDSIRHKVSKSLRNLPSKVGPEVKVTFYWMARWEGGSIEYRRQAMNRESLVLCRTGAGVGEWGEWVLGEGGMSAREELEAVFGRQMENSALTKAWHFGTPAKLGW